MRYTKFILHAIVYLVFSKANAFEPEIDKKNQTSLNTNENETKLAQKNHRKKSGEFVLLDSSDTSEFKKAQTIIPKLLNGHPIPPSAMSKEGGGMSGGGGGNGYLFDGRILLADTYNFPLKEQLSELPFINLMGYYPTELEEITDKSFRSSDPFFFVISRLRDWEVHDFFLGTFAFEMLLTMKDLNYSFFYGEPALISNPIDSFNNPEVSSMVQLAWYHYEKSSASSSFITFFPLFYWNQISPIDQAGLILHEMLRHTQFLGVRKVLSEDSIQAATSIILFCNPKLSMTESFLGKPTIGQFVMSLLMNGKENTHKLYRKFYGREMTNKEIVKKLCQLDDFENI